jgi:hypothetical protein
MPYEAPEKRINLEINVRRRFAMLNYAETVFAIALSESFLILKCWLCLGVAPCGRRNYFIVQATCLARARLLRRTTYASSLQPLLCLKSIPSKSWPRQP